MPGSVTEADYVVIKLGVLARLIPRDYIVRVFRLAIQTIVCQHGYSRSGQLFSLRYGGLYPSPSRSGCLASVRVVAIDCSADGAGCGSRSSRAADVSGARLRRNASDDGQVEILFYVVEPDSTVVPGDNVIEALATASDAQKRTLFVYEVLEVQSLESIYLAASTTTTAAPGDPASGGVAWHESKDLIYVLYGVGGLLIICMVAMIIVSARRQPVGQGKDWIVEGLPEGLTMYNNGLRNGPPSPAAGSYHYGQSQSPWSPGSGSPQTVASRQVSLASPWGGGGGGGFSYDDQDQFGMPGAPALSELDNNAAAAQHLSSVVETWTAEDEGLQDHGTNVTRWDGPSSLAPGPSLQLFTPPSRSHPAAGSILDRSRASLQERRQGSRFGRSPSVARVEVEQVDRDQRNAALAALQTGHAEHDVRWTPHQPVQYLTVGDAAASPRVVDIPDRWASPPLGPAGSPPHNYLDVQRYLEPTATGRASQHMRVSMQRHRSTASVFDEAAVAAATARMIEDSKNAARR